MALNIRGLGEDKQTEEGLCLGIRVDLHCSLSIGGGLAAHLQILASELGQLQVQSPCSPHPWAGPSVAGHVRHFRGSPSQATAAASHPIPLLTKELPH